MAGRVRNYPYADLKRRRRCPDCDYLVVAVGLVECCPQCGQIVGPSMRFEGAFRPPPTPAPTPTMVPPEPSSPVVDVVTQGELF